jgi:nicotinamidase-related amidase
MEPVKINPSKTAFVAIDLQKGILGFPTLPHSPQEVVKNAKALADDLRAKGGFIVWVRVAMAKDGKDRLDIPCDSPMTMKSLPADWSEISPDLGVQPGDHIVTKKQWGAFYGTDLELQLRRRGLDTIILGGIATCFGVESTARAAYERGFRQIFAQDAMSCLSAEGHEHALTRVFPRMGHVRNVAEILSALK